MSAHDFSFRHRPSSISPLVGCFTTGRVPPLPLTGSTEVTAMVPMLVDSSTAAGRHECDWVEFIMSGSSSTPTGGVALLVGDMALYLLFNLLDRPTRQMLALARRQGHLNVLFKNALLPYRDPSMFETLTNFRDATRDDTVPHEWFNHALSLVPVLPERCSEQQPAFLAARTHRAVLLGQADALLALRARRLGAH